ncbi:WAT1-related protein At5g40240-like [Sesamum indicum]|uniref:WAT1-related protein n=1 Tax=Sesamum indicum TaxID=4182 RepID=A0A6I9UL19_SESIN|nr:WAT1-related protein At5g40240-like [Sesamum indicum]
MAGGQYYFYREVLPFVATVMAECTTVGVAIFYKAAVVKGLSYHVFMAYSYAISALVTLPLAYFSHRKTALPPLTLGVFGRIFLLGVIGFVSQSCGYKGIELSNPTMSSAMSNLNPATTFFLAILFRMEKLKLTSVSSQAKIVGTLVSITGALVVVLYQGPMVITTHRHRSPLSEFLSSIVLRAMSEQANWIVGGGLLAAANILLSIWDILQAKFVKDYPAEFIWVFWYNLSSFIVSLPVGIMSEPKLSAWIVPVDVKLSAIVYSGIMGTAFSTIVHIWGLHVKGPVYVAMFKPLSIAIAAILGVVSLGDNLYLGSVVGSSIISVGFYTVMWGKIKEEISDTPEYYSGEASNSNGEAPLLKHYVV